MPFTADKLDIIIIDIFHQFYAHKVATTCKF